MILKNKYVFGCHIMWYELEMVDEHVQSLVNMASDVENKENITFHFCLNLQEKFEKIDWDYFKEKYKEYIFSTDTGLRALRDIFEHKVGPSGLYPANWIISIKANDEDFYNIADYRRDLCYNWCKKVDLVCWSETDSLWPKQTLHALEGLHEKVHEQVPKYIVNFSDRRLWDNSFAPLHPMFNNIPFQNDLEWQTTNEASGKAYMSLERMNEINDQVIEPEVDVFNYPRFDGSCVCFSSELLKSGVNIPHGILLSHEDSAIGAVAKQIMGSNFIQFNFKNLLHVHNRRHPNKRKGILNEDNASGFGDKKGDWWTDLEQKSKENYNNIFNQVKFNEIIK